MNQKTFTAEYTQFIQRAIALAKKAKQHGIETLEDETEDIADEFFKQGLRYIVGGIEPPHNNGSDSPPFVFEEIVLGDPDQ